MTTYRWSGKHAENTTPRLRTTYRVDLAALDAWNRRNAKARAEYYAHDFVSPSVCEACSRPSTARFCNRSDCT